ncbi:MAG: ribosomal RNA small subunit methyltransferase A [Candidatus Pelagibacter sp.]|nr:ribosomal RNA small subunit methyltransferase A [Candidatus Pelagibacter sp.]
MRYVKKSLGQNFLIDKNIIQKIVKTSSIKNEHIFEIGPGTGNLTKKILEAGPKTFYAVEKDKNLYFDLKNHSFFKDKVFLINKDVLKIDFEKILKKNTIIFGNLPYNISTKILINLIKSKSWPPKYKKLILMFQKEVAERIKSDFNSSSYGRLSILTGYRLLIKNSFNISKNCFFPIPKVDSTLIVFEPYNLKNHNLSSLEKLEKITKFFFNNRRKMINKAAKKIIISTDKTLEKLNIKKNLRPSEISKDKYYKLIKYVI